MRRAVIALAAVVLSACGSGGPEPAVSPRPGITASPMAPSLPGPSPSALPAPAPTLSPSPSPDPSQPRDPTDTDRARFIANHRPEDATDLEHVAVDVDGDDIEEVVFVYVRTSTSASRAEVAWWDGTAYAVSWSGDGGAADRIGTVSVRDVNGDGRTEIAVGQSVGGSGGSLSLWRAAVGVPRFDPLIAQGGCSAGSHTYGVVGAELEDRDRDGAAEVYATCDDSPLPVAAWTTDVYVWRDDAYRFDRTRFPGESG